MAACRLEESLIQHSAPSLAGIKTGNLFTVASRLGQDLKRTIAEFNSKMKHKGIRLLPMRCLGNRTLLYIYRPKLLEQDLKQESCRCFLCQLGYPVERSTACLREYISRLTSSRDFPHEIGFFLGYPPDDVIAFMEQGSQKATYSATWRAYSNEAEARKTCQAFKTCKRIYCTNWEKGKSIEQLTVAM
ncbi:MAG: DUF3793 family protein [Bacillota bacterium]|nr:DUF3793 family protein [Bacillota bacterium]